MDTLDTHRARVAFDGHPTQGDNLVFVNHAGNIISRTKLLRRMLKPLCEKAGVPVIVWHELRHTAATLLLDSDIPINNVSELPRNASSVVTAMVYSHVTKAGMERVASATVDIFQPEAAVSN